MTDDYARKMIRLHPDHVRAIEQLQRTWRDWYPGTAPPSFDDVVGEAIAAFAPVSRRA